MMDEALVFELSPICSARNQIKSGSGREACCPSVGSRSLVQKRSLPSVVASCCFCQMRFECFLLCIGLHAKEQKRVIST